MSEVNNKAEETNKTNKTSVSESKKTQIYTKDEILSGNKFTSIEKDILTVLLEDKKKYSINQCVEILKKENRRVIK